MKPLLTLLLILGPLCANGADKKKRCFDFTKPVTKLQRERLPQVTEGLAMAKGTLPNSKIIWSAARDDVNKSAVEMLKIFLDPLVTKNREKTEIELTQIKSPHFIDLRKIAVDVRITFFMSLNWVEQWGYSLLKGTRDNPEQVLISYEKIDGTEYIEHKCGQVFLEKKGPETTDVYIYEETNAVRWDLEKAQDSQRGTFATISKPS